MFIIESCELLNLVITFVKANSNSLTISRELANLSKCHSCSCSFNQSLMSLWHVSPLWHEALKHSTDLLSWPTTTLRWPLAPLWPYCWPSTSSEGLFNPLNGLVTCSPPINLALLQQFRVLCPLPFIHLLGTILQGEGAFPQNNLHGGFWDQRHYWQDLTKQYINTRQHNYIPFYGCVYMCWDV